MDYIIIGLLVVLIVIGVISLMKNIDEADITERLSKLEVYHQHNIQKTDY